MKRKFFFQIFIIILPFLLLIPILIFQNSFTQIDLIQQNLSKDKAIKPSNSLNLNFDAQDLIGLTPDLWVKNLTGKGITVAVLDSGIFPNHSVFTQDGAINWTKRIKAFYDESIDNTSPNPIDIQWHGTWAASILGGNSSTYQGVAPAVDFVIMQIFHDLDGQIITNLTILQKAVNWVISNKDVYNIKIVSMSFGIKPTDENLIYIDQINDAVEQLVKAGILVVAAAGNNGDEGIKTINAPGSSELVLSIGGVDYGGEMYYKSSLGPTHGGFKKPDVCAPAVSVYGAYPGELFAYVSGTSASTPFVSGLAALMLEKDASLNPLELKNIISLSSYRTINPLFISDNRQGWGIVQGYAALEALNPTISLTKNSIFSVDLTENYSVFCQPIRLVPNYYFFEVIQEDSLSADLYLFDKQPIQNGSPKLVSHTINSIDPFERMGIYTGETHDYFLVLKSHSRGSGGFEIKLIIDLRNLIYVGFALFNVVCLIYVSHLKLKINKEIRN